MWCTNKEILDSKTGRASIGLNFVAARLGGKASCTKKNNAPDRAICRAQKRRGEGEIGEMFLKALRKKLPTSPPENQGSRRPGGKSPDTTEPPLIYNWGRLEERRNSESKEDKADQRRRGGEIRASRTGRRVITRSKLGQRATEENTSRRKKNNKRRF